MVLCGILFCSIVLLPRFISCAAARPSASFVYEQFVQQSRCFLQRRAPPLPIIETQKSPCERCGLTRFTMFCFFISTRQFKKCHFEFFFALKQVFSPLKCLPWTASSASAPRRQLIWMLPRSTTCGPSAPPSPCLLV